jgi:NADPH:quinone reductase-like Zn-dependent oxidoreductase
MLGIQYAKLSGLHVIVAASPDHADYLKSLGADDVFDYRSPTCGADINKLTNNKLAYAWDCVGTGEAVCGAALSTTGPSKYGSINLASSAEALKKANPVAEGPLLVLAYNAVGENFEYQKTIIRPSTEEVEFGIEFKAATLELVAKGSLKLVRTAVNNGGSGLEGVMKGMNEMRQGKVRCQKLVYTI